VVVAGQSGSPASGRDFSSLVAELTAARDDASAESPALEKVQEQALQALDTVALAELNSGKSDLAAINARLAMFVTHQPPIGEGYSVVRLGSAVEAGGPAIYALLADFGLSGPSAVRVYAGAPGRFALAARVDRYAQKDFLDDYVELVPIPGPAPVFVTVAGRTDDLQTVVFTAWFFDGRAVSAVWNSDILQDSTYQASPDGFRVTYCSQTDPGGTGKCDAMQRDRYAWQAGAWKRIESTPLPAAAPAR